MRCPVCRRQVIWIKKESGRKVLIDLIDQDNYVVDRSNIFDPSTHQEHALVCYVPYSRRHKYSIKQPEPISV